MTAREDSCTVYYAGHGVRRDTRVGAFIKPCGHWCNCGTVLRQNNAPWFDMLFMRGTEECGYIFHVVETTAHNADASTSSLPAAILDFSAFDEAF